MMAVYVIIIIVSAVLTSLLTCALAFFWFRTRVRPSLMEQVDEEFQRRLAEAGDVLAERVEEAVRRGLVEGVSALPTREVLQGTTRTLARTSAEIVEDRVNRLFRRRRDGRDGER